MSKDVIIDIIDLIIESIHLVQERFSRIRVPDDSILAPEGITLLDAISMRLLVIGESVKRIEKTDLSLLQRRRKVQLWGKLP